MGEAVAPVALVAAVSAAVEAAVEAEWWRASDGELARLVRAVETARRRLDAVALRLAREVDDRGLASTAGYTSTGAWLGALTHTGYGAGRAAVRLADELAIGHPAVGEALAGGRLSRAHASVIMQVLGRLPADLDPAVATQAEARLISEAASFDPAALARLGERLLLALDPDGAEPAPVADLVARRELLLRDRRDGSVVLAGQLDPEAGALMRAVLDSLSAPCPSGEQPDPRPPARRRADALVEVLARVADSGQLPSRGGTRPHLTVTIPVHVLTGEQAGSGELSWGGAISGEVARRLGCDATVMAVVLDSLGVPLTAGREQRTVPPVLRRALEVRDGGCAFCDCDRPPSWCHAHHIVPWSQGGSTSLDNLVLLCGHHHRTVHHTRWAVRIGPHGRPQFRPPALVNPDQPWIDSPRRQ